MNVFYVCPIQQTDTFTENPLMQCAVRGSCIVQLVACGLFNMRGFWKEVNEYFSATSIHGFPYISNTQSRPTRFIWTLIVLCGLGFATFFLYETISGFEEHYITTTTETKSVKDYPFPAVTFHPGVHNSKYAFLKNFFNEFEFTRYHLHLKSRPSLLDNDKFIRLYEWLVSPMSDHIFADIE